MAIGNSSGHRNPVARLKESRAGLAQPARVGVAGLISRAGASGACGFSFGRWRCRGRLGGPKRRHWREWFAGRRNEYPPAPPLAAPRPQFRRTRLWSYCYPARQTDRRGGSNPEGIGVGVIEYRPGVDRAGIAQGPAAGGGGFLNIGGPIDLGVFTIAGIRYVRIPVGISAANKTVAGFDQRIGIEFLIGPAAPWGENQVVDAGFETQAFDDGAAAAFLPGNSKMRSRETPVTPDSPSVR